MLLSGYVTMKLNCEKWRDLASEYIEGTLAEPMARAMREHTASCETCRSDESALRSLMGELSALPEVDPPQYFHENVMAAVERAQKEQPVGPWWKTLSPRVFRTGVGTLLVGTAAGAALLALTIPRTESGGKEPVIAGVPTTNLLPGPAPATDNRPTQAPRLRIARKIVNLPERGQAMEFTFWLEDARSGTVRFDIAGVREPYSFDMSPEVRKTLQVPYDVAAGKPILDLRVTWTVDGARHTRYVFVPTAADIAEPLPARQTFQLPAGTLTSVARAVATRYGVPVTLEDIPADAPVTVDAHNETAEEVLHRTAAAHGLSVASSSAGLLMQVPTAATPVPGATPTK